MIAGILVALAASAWSGASPAADKPELILYTYDSFVAKGGLGPEIIPLFEKRCACRVRALASGDGGQILTRLQIDAERGGSVADLVVGIDQHLWDRAKPLTESWGSWRPSGYEKLEPSVKVEDGFLPFDYGVMAFMSDSKALAELKLKPPESLEDLTKPEWRRNVILQDPRTSTPGLGFLLYTRAVHGASVWDYWKRLRGQWLTLAPGWDGAYGIFLKKEAPLVWSYVTSQAYHAEHGDVEGRYRALVFREGQPLQIEGAALVKGRPEARRELAKRFLEFLISPEVQERIPQRNWMMPVLKGVKVPPSFAALSQPTKLHSARVSAREVEEALSGWTRTLAGAK